MALRYILRRLAFLVMVVWAAASLCFILPHLTPRDPITEQITIRIATMGLNAEGAQAMIDAHKKVFGLDQPLWTQYVIYLRNMLRFDLGYSITQYPKPVIEIIGESVGWTLRLVATSTVLAFLVGTILGALLGWRRSPKILNLLLPPLMIFSAAPAFVLALILIYFLAFRARLFPLGRAFDLFMAVDWSNPAFWVDYLRHAVLPAVSLILVSLGSWGLGMRAMMVTVEGADYMTFGESTGLKGIRLFFTYGVRNALLPQITGLAIQLGTIVAGSALVEVYFQYPGLGTRLNQAIQTFDYYTIYGIVFFMVCGIALTTFLVDIFYPLLDPRISYSKGA
jgi:peptide/nickel transport system permease protein